jgi:ectoine hydroxylase-related dioxygenase (phytanoyl-CoA dioxygenase family)
MLGLTSLSIAMNDTDILDEEEELPLSLEILVKLTENELRQHITGEKIHTYHQESVCTIPKALSVNPSLMRRITDELLWGDKYPSDKSYETIRVLSREGKIVERRKVTRLENFVPTHHEWSTLCAYIGHLASIICGQPMVLFKEKLNLKPPGGSGFAPHLDTPSLRVALGDDGPQDFVTVMVAIDSMTEANGCLQFAKGNWSEDNAVGTIQPEKGPNNNPDGNGREGAISVPDAQNLQFVPYECSGGTIVLFKGWVPHKSAANQSPFPRRAVFLTYNPAQEGGSCREAYYQQMERLRSEFRIQTGLERQRDAQLEMDALATIPQI